MPVDLIGAEQNLLEAARQRLKFGPAPSWTRPCPLRPDFKAKQLGHQTHLLVDRQYNAETRETFLHDAIRLETLQGVHRRSQWRVDFDPATQLVTIHSVAVRRGNGVVEQGTAERFHLVNLEAGGDVDVEGIAGLTLLEDVRPGDILEWSYTIEEHSPVLAEHAMAMFTAPPSAPVGLLHFVVCFSQTRAMKWKSFAADFEPEETLGPGEITWVWKRENYPGSWPEENTPDWFIDYPWAQVSDCPDWESISTALSGVWKDDPTDGTVGQMARKIAHENESIHRQIEQAIQLVQDEFRTLPTNPVHLLHAPTPSGLVAKRRFGESKDLSFLLCRLLQALQVTARPVLVNTVWRQSLGTLLPMALFDRALVEYQVRGETRWVDPTAKRQGGGSLNRVIRDYGMGLPISPSARLTNAPDTAAQTSLHELKELVLLDTAGAPSWLSVQVAARGSQAEELRRLFDAEGAAAIARKRLQQCAERFGNARRIGEMEFRDDRAANLFLLAEGFEISGFLTEDAKPGVYKFTLPNDFIVGALKMPDVETRRTPFALPFPCNLVHIVEVHCLALPIGLAQTRNVENSQVTFSKFRKTLAGDWTTKYTLSTLSDSVPAEGVEEYRKTLRDIRNESTWTMLVPAGQGRPHQRGDFGRLPNSWQQAAHEGAAAPAASVPFRAVERVAKPVAPKAPVGAARMASQPDAAPTVKSPGGRAKEMSGPLEGTLGSNGRETELAANGANGESAGEPVKRYKRRKRHKRRRRDPRELSARTVFWIIFALAIALTFIWLIVRGPGPTLPKIETPVQAQGN